MVKARVRVLTFPHSLKLPAQEKKCELFKSFSLFVVEGLDEGDCALVGEVDRKGPEAISERTKNFAPKHNFYRQLPEVANSFQLMGIFPFKDSDKRTDAKG
jgi:hypothetical protein